MLITDHVYQVGGAEFSHPSDAGIFLIREGSEAALIDAGTGRGHDFVMRNIQSCGVAAERIRFLFITHCHYDHTGGVQRIKDETGCDLVAHALDAIYLESGDPEVTAASWYGSTLEPLSIDIAVTEKARTFSVGNLAVKMYHIPGHSPGSSAFTVQSGEKMVLFGQDVHGPLNEVLLSNRDDYIKSLEFLISLNADILCEGHFGIYEGKERVRRFIESFL